jgi:hypothetical protein
MVSMTRSIGRRFTAFGSVIRFSNRPNPAQNLYVLTSEERISPRLSIRQTMTRSEGHTSMGWGGRFLSNRVTLGLDYQTIFTPLAIGFGGRQFVQAWMVSVQFSLPRGAQFHYDNLLDPFGRVRYTAYGSGIGYSREGEMPLTSVPSLSTASGCIPIRWVSSSCG